MADEDGDDDLFAELRAVSNVQPPTSQQGTQDAVTAARTEVNELLAQRQALQDAAERSGLDRTSVATAYSLQVMGIDICFMMDCTGSMGSWIEQCRTKIGAILSEARSFTGETAVNVAFVGYRDVDDTDRIVMVDFVSYDNLSRMHDVLGRVTATGGADECEDVAGALEQVCKLKWSTSTRLVLHFGDAPPHGRRFYQSAGDSHPDGVPGQRNIEEMLQELSSRGIDYYFVEINQSTAVTVNIFRQAYEVGGSINGNATGRGQFSTIPLGADSSQFLPAVVKSISMSVSSRRPRMAPAVSGASASRPSPAKHVRALLPGMASASPATGMLASPYRSRLPALISAMDLSGSAATALQLQNEIDDELQMLGMRAELDALDVPLDGAQPQWNAPDGLGMDKWSPWTALKVKDLKLARRGQLDSKLILGDERTEDYRICKRPFARGTFRWVHFAQRRSDGAKMVVKKPIMILPQRSLRSLAYENTEAMIRSQLHAADCAVEFNRRNSGGQVVKYLTVTLVDAPDNINFWTFEPLLEGKFTKFLNNNGDVFEPDHDTPQALAHFSHSYWEQNGILLDVQGALIDGTYHLTDPAVASTRRLFGESDTGADGVSNFASGPKRHVCGQVCRKLGLRPISA